MTNLTEGLPKDERYSFIFEDNSQSRDHILVSPVLVWGAQFDIVHVNVEFAETSERAGDHDPLIIGIRMGERDDEGDEDTDDQKGGLKPAPEHLAPNKRKGR